MILQDFKFAITQHQKPTVHSEIGGFIWHDRKLLIQITQNKVKALFVKTKRLKFNRLFKGDATEVFSNCFV